MYIVTNMLAVLPGAEPQNADNFYQNSDAMSQYDNRMAHILNYVSPSNGIAWGNWSEAILAFDIENEPFQQALDLAGENDPSDWLCGRAGKMADIIAGSGVKLATGGVGGDQSHGYNFMSKAIECSAIDMISMHGYVSTSSFWSFNLPTSVSTASANNKTFYVEEWGYNTE